MKVQFALCTFFHFCPLWICYYGMTFALLFWQLDFTCLPSTLCPFANCTLTSLVHKVHFAKSPSLFHELTRWVHVVKSALPSHQVHIKNLLSPCCQVHFAKSPSSYHELVESMLSSPFCQVTKFVSWTHWVHVVKSTLPSHQVCIINLLSPHCQVHVTNHQLHVIMTMLSCGLHECVLTWQKKNLIYKLPNAWNCIPSLPELLFGSQSTAPKENKIAYN
jgi:hypothetical protein